MDQDPLSMEGTTIITMVVILIMEVMDIAIMAIKMAMVKDEMENRIVPTPLHRQRRI
jgi:hypothetical protein